MCLSSVSVILNALRLRHFFMTPPSPALQTLRKGA